MLIHIEPGNLIENSSKIDYGVQDMQELVHLLHICTNRLDMGWQGTVADEVQSELEQITDGMNRHVQSLQDLALVMRQQAEKWMESDQVWVIQYRSIAG